MTDKKTARALFVAACETHIEDLRQALELYLSGKVGTHEGGLDTTERSIQEVLFRLKEWERLKGTATS